MGRSGEGFVEHPGPRLDAIGITRRARDAYGPDGRPALPLQAGRPIFPFETAGLRMRPVEDPVLPEPPRNGETGDDCWTCGQADDQFVLADNRRVWEMAHLLPQVQSARWRTRAGKSEHEPSPGEVLWVDQDCAPVALDDVAGEGQPKANTSEGGASGAVEAGETVEDEFAGTIGDAGAVVAHRHHRARIPLDERERDC